MSLRLEFATDERPGGESNPLPPADSKGLLTAVDDSVVSAGVPLHYGFVTFERLPAGFACGISVTQSSSIAYPTPRTRRMRFGPPTD